MARYHIKDDGNPGVCKANEGKCPKGGAHFDSETEAREAVEKLFGGAFHKAPEPLAVYTKTATKAQFDQLPGYGRHYGHRDPAFEHGSDHVHEVYKMLTESRMDVKSQNLVVRENLEAKISSMKSDRDNGTEEEKVAAAVAFEYLSPILGEHYSLEDPRNSKQKAADRDFVQQYGDEYAEAPAYSEAANLASSGTSEETLRALATYEARDPASLTDAELEHIHSMNPQSQVSESRWRANRERLDSLAYYRNAKDRKAKADTVPDDMQEYLVDSMKSAKVQEEIEEARHEIITVASKGNGGSGRRIYEHATPIAEVASNILAVREDNELLRRHVIEA